LTIRTGHPDFLDLPWDCPLAAWETPRLVRHVEHRAEHRTAQRSERRRPVRQVAYGDAIYTVKELPAHLAQREYTVLRALEGQGIAVASPVELVEGRHQGAVSAREADPDAGADAALITRLAPFSFTYREIVSRAGVRAGPELRPGVGPGMGPEGAEIRRAQLVDALAGLLVELHVAGCFWGDSSLDSVLLRRDGDGVVAILIDAEGALLRERLDDDVRAINLDILGENLAAAMVDVATAQGMPLASADVWLGADVAARYQELWDELFGVAIFGADEQHKIAERVERVHELGFDIRSLAIEPTAEGRALALEIQPGRRHFHASRLARLTGIEVAERQARQLLADLQYYRDRHAPAADDSLAAVEWRVFVLEPMLARIRAVPGVSDPVQGYCDLLVHRYLRSEELGCDVGTDAAFDDWVRRLWPCAA
jgi:hypothetical protein